MWSNCLIWAIKQKVKHGGRIKWYKSKFWKGFHTTWVDKEGVEWEYTTAKIKRPWWYIPIFYKGVIRKINS
jgi:hypothetical protein